MKTGLISLLILITSCSSVLFAQKYTNEGTDFWFAYPKVTNEIYATAISTTTFEVHITSKTAATGTISIDEHVWPIAYPAFSATFSVLPGEVKTVTLPTGNLHNINYQFVYALFNLYSVHVTATAPVAVFASKHYPYQPTASSIMPTSSLGSEYFVTTKPSYAGGPGITSESGVVVVVAPGNPVTVVVTSPIDVKMTNPPPQPNILDAGVPDTIDIAARGTLQIMTVVGGEDLTGLKIEALNGTDVFAVYSGHAYEKKTGHTADPMFELEYPTDTWGDEYIISPGEDLLVSDYRVIAMSNATDVFVDGVYYSTLNEGEYYEDTISITKVITGSNPIKVTYFMPHRVDYGILTYNPGDNSMCNIVSNDKMYLDTATFFHFAADIIDSSFVKVITRTADIATVAVNGVIINNWQAVPNLPSYSHSYTKMDTGASVLTTTGCGFLAYVHGFGNYESYNYALGAFSQHDSINITDLSIGSSGLCNYDTIQFSSSASDSVLTYKWKFGDGDSSGISSPTHAYATGGTYPISLILNYKCYSDTLLDTIAIQQCCLTDTIGFTYTYPDPCDSSIVEFTATSTGQMDSIWWSMGFPGGSGLTGMTETVNFSQVKTYNINLWIYG
ncbi:MAG TPA: PKD domain-containing protein, partial [Flavobacteriales bacterium]|nr:PKD domain-containing protein [Flavobacteriales bacterium]